MPMAGNRLESRYATTYATLMRDVWCNRVSRHGDGDGVGGDAAADPVISAARIIVVT
jgi:hypothetical protein